MGFNKSGGSGNNNNNNSNPLDNSLSYRAQNKKSKKKGMSEAFTGDGSG